MNNEIAARKIEGFQDMLLTGTDHGIRATAVSTKSGSWELTAQCCVVS
jgi:hypothetical protein